MDEVYVNGWTEVKIHKKVFELAQVFIKFEIFNSIDRTEEYATYLNEKMNEKIYNQS